MPTDTMVSFSGRFFQVNVKTMNKASEHWFELHVAKCLIVHVLSNGYDVKKKK